MRHSGKGGSKWDSKGFDYLGDKTHRIIYIADWHVSYFHQESTTYPPKKTSLDANLANNSSITLINPYMHTYSNVEAIMVRNTV